MSFARPAPVDVSYLQARESGYGRARASSAALPGLAPPQRDLTDELEEHRQSSAAVPGSALRVFLRVRPELDGDFADLPQEERKSVLEAPNNVHLLMHAPKDSATYRNGMNGGGKLTHRYTFSHIFRPETDQQQLFRQTTLNHVTEFVNGHNCLLFTYGATNSGKTYTVQGTPSEPGLLPRTLDMLFNSLDSRLYGRLDVQPRAFSDVCLVSGREEEAALRLTRQTLLLGGAELPDLCELTGSRAASEESLNSLCRSQESLGTSIESLSEIRLCAEIEGRRRESAVACMDNQPHTRFSVWVSYFEIYNEYVYDLLERPPTGQRRRTALHLGLDRKGNSYVKGLRQVPVRSADEAIQVVRAGRQNLHFASNRLNHNSSRSHCVFTVRLIRLLDTDNPSVARVSQFSVCDLAGSERVEKTLAAGARMKEAGNINTSLMVLGRCMKAMRQAQKAGGGVAAGPAMVPYRDSKLTRIFQSYFCGSGLGSRVTMVVNVSPSPLVFDETIQVLKFSALAKQVSVQQAEKRRGPSRFSMMARRSVQAVAAALGRPRPLLDSTAATMDAAAAEEHQNLLDLVESLRHQLVETRRENTGLEERIRQELCAEFEQHVVQIEKGWQERMQETERYMEIRAEQQVTAVTAGIKAEYSRKRRRTADMDDEAEREDEEEEVDKELEVARERLEAAEQRCLLLEQQLEAESADREQACQRAAQRQQELSRLAAELAEQRGTSERLQRERDEAVERHRRLLETGAAADQSVAAELGRQVTQLQEELRFKDMDLRETREYLQEGGDEFLQLEAASERMQRQLIELQQQLAQRDEALRDQQALQADLEHLLAGRTQRVEELETQLERHSARGRPVQPAIPEEDGPQNPAEMSFGSRMRELRTKTNAALRQVARSDGEQRRPPAPDAGRTVQTAEREVQTTGRQSETAEQQTQTAETLTADRETQTAETLTAHRETQTAEQRTQTAEEETQTDDQSVSTAEHESQTDHQSDLTAEQGSQTAEDGRAALQERQLAEAQAESARLAAELTELQLRADRLTAELRIVTDQLTARTAECDELRSRQDSLAAEAESLQDQLRQLTEERDRLRAEPAARLAEAHREVEDLQRQYKQALHLKAEAEADAAVCEREMKATRAELDRERERHDDGPLQERLRAREAEVTLLKDSRDQVSEALRIIKAELEAKSEELRQNNAVELRAQLERAEADSAHLSDELEKRSNELFKLKIQIENLKRQLTERDEDLQKARDERTRSMQMSEQNIRRKNEELNRERHESSHLRDMMARLTPRSSSTLQAELETARADCRRKDDRIEQLESRLRSSQAELAACTPTPTPRRAAGRTRSVQIVGEDGESEVTPMVLRGRSGGRKASRAAPPQEPTETEHSEEEEAATTATGRRRTRRRRAANRSAVRFTDENAEPEPSEGGSSVSGGAGGGGKAREPLLVIGEQQQQQQQAVTPADQPPPPRTVKSTATKRKLFKRCSDQIMECSPVQTAEKRVSPRTVVTRSLRSRKK